MYKGKGFHGLAGNETITYHRVVITDINEQIGC